MAGQNALEMLIELTQNRLDDAARNLGKLLASERADEQKLELLTNYRHEYQNKFMAAAQNGLSPDAWSNYQVFLSRLDEAVALQTRIVTQAKQRSVAGQKVWMAERTKSKAYGTLQQRIESREAARESKREQKAADEHAVKGFLKQQQQED